MKRHVRGYTMIEVMTALGLLAVGAAGVVAMQKAAVVGNSSARSIAIASAIAARWAERLRVDAMVWNDIPAQELAQTRWLKTVTSSANVWTLPTELPGKVAPYADPLGADIIDANDTSAVAYCTHISYRLLSPKAVSAVVRVTWRRDSSPINCSAADLFVPNTDSSRYGAIYLTVGAVTQEKQQ
jgi:prepilin-type N-terminal cleavage/methylation domain-containing protein